MTNLVEISFQEVRWILWARRRWLILAIIAALVAGIVYAVVSSSRYEATMTLVRNDIETSSELTSFGSSILGFAGFGASDTGPFEIFLNTLQSDEVYDRLYEDDPDLIHDLLRLSDEERQAKAINLSLLSPRRYVHLVFGLPASVPIDGARAKEYIDSMVSIENRADIVRILVRHESSEMALKLLSGLVETADDVVREGYAVSIGKRIDFISEYLRQEQPVSIVGALSRRQETLLSHFVALEVDSSYSFHVVAEPRVGAVATPPPLLQIVGILLAVFLGLAVWLAVIVFPPKAGN